MKCDTIQIQLIDYLERQLPESTRLEVESHLRLCASCREKLVFFQTIEQVIEKEKESVPPVFLQKRIVSSILEEKQITGRERIRLIRHVRRIAAIAALFVGIVLGTLVANRLYNIEEDVNEIWVNEFALQDDQENRYDIFEIMLSNE